MGVIKKVLSMRRFSFLLQQLVRRDFKIKYRGSLLGVIWSVLNPLLNMIVLSVVFSQVFRAVDNYKMYLLSGIVMFNFFNDATSIALTSVVSNFGLITKVYFPKIVIPLSKVLSSCINLLISVTVFIILGSFMGLSLWPGYFIIPYVLACLLLFSCGVSFVISAMQVFFRDMQHLYGVITVIWMYSTPILYPMDIIPVALLPLFRANPMYIFIDFLRQITLYQTLPTPESYFLCALWGIGMFVIGGIAFVKTQDKFIYYT